MGNVTHFYSIANFTGETATIKYLQCQEIVQNSIIALRSERDLALLFLFALVMFIIIKALWSWK